MRACGDYFVHVDELQFDAASPPNPLPPDCPRTPIC